MADVMSRPEGRRANLPVAEDVPPRPDFPTLQILLQQIIDLANFDGLAAIYVRDLRTGEDLHMVYDRNQVTATEPASSMPS